MKILLIEPFYTGSHKQWADNYKKFSQHDITILSLAGRHWKWRMHGGAVSLTRLFTELHIVPDLILATDMVDLGLFLSLNRKILSSDTPAAIYFHENQLTYPWSPTDKDIRLKRDNHYAFINYSSALSAELILFNSDYHKNSFMEAIPAFLKQFPDFWEIQTIPAIETKSQVLYLGMELAHLYEDNVTEKTGSAVLLWNHRWEYDKNPDIFFHHLFRLQDEHIDFRLIVLGNAFRRKPAVFEQAKARLKKQILHFGYVDSKQEYEQLIRKADILPVCSIQDFFGGSVVEAIAADCFPILPDRLAYPEHIPLENRAEHLYQNDKQCYKMLKAAILNISKIRQKKYSHFVSRYDWSNLAPQYDRQLNKLVCNNTI